MSLQYQVRGCVASGSEQHYYRTQDGREKSLVGISECSCHWTVTEVSTNVTERQQSLEWPADICYQLPVRLQPGEVDSRWVLDIVGRRTVCHGRTVQWANVEELKCYNFSVCNVVKAVWVHERNRKHLITKFLEGRVRVKYECPGPWLFFLIL